MATGGFGPSIKQASDMIYDYICSPCEDDNLNAEALYYCKNCFKQFCDICEKFHKKFHKHHVVLGKAEVQNWGPVKTENALEYCEDHPGERIKTYCEDHDAVCCPDCVSVKHRSCKSVSYISDAAAGFHQTPEYQQLLGTVRDIIKQLNDTEQSKKKDINDLIESRKQILSVIQQLKGKLIQQLDDIETRTIKELDDLLKTTNDAIIEDLNRCTDIHEDLKKYLDGLQHKRTPSDTVAFTGYRKCGKKMTEANGLFKEIALKPTGKFVFKEDPETEKLLATVQTFGQPISTQAFGLPSSGRPGFGQPFSTQAFGHPSSGKPGFGQPFSIQALGHPSSGKPGFGLHDSSTQAFGQPSSGKPGFGLHDSSTQAFGQPSSGKPGFGLHDSSTQAYGQPSRSKPGFGLHDSSTQAFGQPSSGKPGFEPRTSSTQAFGQPSSGNPGFEPRTSSTQAFGQPSSGKPGFEPRTSSTQAFGQPSSGKPGF